MRSILTYRGRMLRPLIIPLCLILSVSACRSSIRMTDAAANASIDESNKVPASAFVGNPLFSHLTLSPSGRRLAVMLSREEKDALISIDLITGERAPLAILERREYSKSGSSKRLEEVAWASEDFVMLTQSLLSPAAGSRGRTFHLLSSSISEPRLRPLGFGRVISTLPDDPKSYLALVRGKAQRADLRTGRRRGVELKKRGVGSWQVDHEFKVRIGFSGEEHNNDFEVWGRISDQDKIEKLVKWDPLSDKEKGEGFYFRGFSEQPHIIYVTSERETGRFAIYEYDLRERSLGPVLFEHPDYGVESIRTSAVDGRLLSVSHIEDVPVTRFVDAEYQSIWAPIERDFLGKTVSIVSTDRNETSSIFVVSADDSPPTYYRLDHDSGEYSRLFRAKPALAGLSFPEMEPVHFQSRDGLEIHGYLTRPPKAEGPIATIVFPHGGPLYRNYRRWNSYVQFLVSRGFAVFQLNYRGSTGYGREFREAGYKQFGRAMQDDITDGVDWLIDQGIADPDRIGIFGIGYGGYAALQGLTSTPHLYAAGASYAGISDIVTLLDDDNLAYYGIDEVNKALIGSRWTDRDYLREVSPAHHADQIKVPVLLGHGTNDWNYNIRHTDKMTSALENAGVEHEVYRYRGESHEFLDERTRIDFFQKMGRFFERHLKPDPAHVLRPHTSPKQ